MNSPELVLVTWFHADAPERAGNYAQTLGDSASPAHYETYLRCVDLCVASFRRWNPSARALVILNPRAELTLSAARRSLWDSLAVERLVEVNTHVPEHEFYSRWQNQTYLFDVIRAALHRLPDGGTPVAIIDSDCLVRRDLSAMARAISDSGFLPMRIGFAPDQEVHGVTRRDLGRMHEAWRGESLAFDPAYLGGELVAGTGDELERMLQDVESVYQWSLNEHAAGRMHPNEEAQMISIARPIREEQATGNRWLDRIWTQPWTFRSVPPTALEIPVWHLPAEKKTGLRFLHREVSRRDSWFWVADESDWDRRVGGATGTPHYGLRKGVRDGWALAPRIPGAVARRLRHGERQPGPIAR